LKVSVSLTKTSGGFIPSSAVKAMRVPSCEGDMAE